MTRIVCLDQLRLRDETAHCWKDSLEHNKEMWHCLIFLFSSKCKINLHPLTHTLTINYYAGKVGRQTLIRYKLCSRNTYGGLISSRSQQVATHSTRKSFSSRYCTWNKIKMKLKTRKPVKTFLVTRSLRKIFCDTFFGGRHLWIYENVLNLKFMIVFCGVNCKLLTTAEADYNCSCINYIPKSNSSRQICCSTAFKFSTLKSDWSASKTSGHKSLH